MAKSQLFANKIDSLIEWRVKNVSDKQFMLVLAFLVGVFAALAAFVLHSSIHAIQHLLTSRFYVKSYNWLYLVFPIVGIWLTSLFVKYVVRDNISHGITRILYAISTKQSRLKVHNCWSSVFASAITIGFGGSVGAEAPIVLTGSSIASNLGQLFRLNNKTLMLLVGCGAAAAIAGIFKAPIAGLVFTIEVLMIDLTMASISPILIASVTATCFAYILMGDDKLFQFTLDNPWIVERVPSNILLGVFCGLVSLYFIRTMTACEGIFEKLRQHRYWKLALGGAMLSVLIFFFPSLYGEGYKDINILLEGRTQADWNAIMNGSLFYGNEALLIVYIGMIILTKAVATASTNGGGGCGGTFAPSLFIGAFAGFFFAHTWNIYNVGIYLPEKNFALLGMAGVMSGVMHAPLTGIFLIAELTAGYDLFMPLMIVAVSSYLTILIFEPHSIYGMRLAREGKLITHHTDRAVLTLMSLENVINRKYVSVEKDMELGELVHALSKSGDSIVPVLDKAGCLLGEIHMNKLRHIVFRTELYNHFTVAQLMVEPATRLRLGDPMEDVVKAFDKYNAQHLPVLDDAHHLIGYVSRSHVYAQYRQMVADLSND